MVEGTPVAVGVDKRPEPPAAREPREDPPQATRIRNAAQWIVAAALATVTVWLPLTWLVVSLVVLWIVGSVRVFREDGGGLSGAVLAPVLALRAARGARGFWGSVLRTLIQALLVIVVVATVPPLLAGEPYAVPVRLRLTLIEYGPVAALFVLNLHVLRRALGILATLPLVKAFGLGREAPATAAAVVGVAFVALVWLTSSPAKVDPLAVVPVADEVRLRWRADLARAQSDAVVRCIEEKTGIDWQGTIRTRGGQLTLRVRQGDSGWARATREDTAAVLMALHNQVLAAVERFEIQRIPRTQFMLFERGDMDFGARPLEDSQPFALVSPSPVELFPSTASGAEISKRCGARHV